MTVVVDTNFVLALYDASDRHHERAAAWVETLDEDLVTTPLCVAELDHFVRTRGGEETRDAFWGDLEAGAYVVRWWADGLAATLRVARQFPFAGLTDASLVALAPVVRTDRIATFDTDFRSLTLPDGAALTLLPDDA